MKLFFSPTSPYVRKVLVVAHELGLSDRIEKLASAAHPVNRDRTILAHNPLGQVPTLLTDAGEMIADSRVICEYLDDLGAGSLFPKDRALRWRALVDQTMADGAVGAALIARYETTVRPPDRIWREWIDGQMDKIATVLASLETAAPTFGDRVDIGTISYACALSYLDLRFAELDWRANHPAAAAWHAGFEARPALVANRLAG